jgi:uroporphyrinogen-III synthase
MSRSISILSTKHLDTSARDWAMAEGWEMKEMEFIQTDAIPLNHAQLKSLDSIGPGDVVVFTSENAVNYLPAVQNTATWHFGCIGHKTLQKVQERFPQNQIRYTANNSRDLADKIADGKCYGDVFFICAEEHRTELAIRLKMQRIRVETIPVYKTEKHPQSIDQGFSGILFFSPSGVESFFQLNRTKEGTIYAAIGDTTAGALRNYTERVIVSQTPTQEALLQCVKTYYENNSLA